MERLQSGDCGSSARISWVMEERGGGGGSNGVETRGGGVWLFGKQPVAGAGREEEAVFSCLNVPIRPSNGAEGYLGVGKGMLGVRAAVVRA